MTKREGTAAILTCLLWLIIGAIAALLIFGCSTTLECECEASAEEECSVSAKCREAGVLDDPKSKKPEKKSHKGR